MTKLRGLLVGCCAALTVWCSAANAVVCVVPDAGGTAQMPPNCPGGYQSPQDVHLIIDGLPPGTTIQVDATHAKFGLTSSGPGGSLGGQFEQFSSFGFLQLTGTGALAGYNHPVAMQLFCETHLAPRTPGQPIQSFDTAMWMMQGQLPPGDPDFDLLRITAGTGFGLPSPGHTTLVRQGGAGAPWAVDSFFDITYRIDYIGSAGGPLAGRSGSTTGTIRMGAGGDAACCLPGGACVEIPERDCCAQGGLPQAGRACSTAGVCQSPNTNRPCCLPNGTCIMALTVACCAQGGTPGPAGGSCTTPGICPAPPTTVACCFASGGCQDMTTSQCAAAGGTAGAPGSSCANTVCAPPTGACCFPSGACQDISQNACNAGGGSWGGAGSTCALVHCLPQGACCIGTSDCTYTPSASACSGTWHGIGSTCDDLDGDGRPDVCATPPVCGPAPTTTGCSNTACPNIGDSCTAKCAQIDPFSGTVTVTDCDCQNPNDCHVVPHAGPSPLRGGGNSCVVPDNGSGTVTLPPAGCAYLSPDDVHMIIDGLPAGTTVQLTGIHRDFVCNRQPGAPTVCSHPVDADCDEPGGSLGGQQECADSNLQLQLQGTGGMSSYSRSLVMPLSFETHVAPRVPGQPVQSFDTDMFRLFGQLPAGDPDFDLLRIVGGTDFGLPSPGHTTLTQLPGGNWAVDSFFDITYRIDFVGHSPGPFAGRSGSTTGTIRMGTGAGAGCQGNCPVGTTCNETRTVGPNGQIDVCCNCVPVQQPGAPLADGSACNGGDCPDDTDECHPKCVDVNPFTGQVRVVACDCATVDECHLVGTHTTAGGGLRGGGGNPCVVPDNGGTISLPPQGCEYLSPDDVHRIVAGLDPGTTIELAPIHKNFICSGPSGHQGTCSFIPPPGFCEQPGGTMAGFEDCSDSELDLNMNGTGGLAGFNRMIPMPVQFEVHSGPRTVGDPVQSFDTQMMRVFGQITGDPDFDLLRITGGTDFGMPSPGHTTLTQLPGGNWAVDSFFDITYRIDFVGSNTSTWPGIRGHSGSTTATIRMGTGGLAGQCQGVCPPGTTCHETRTVDAAGNIHVCCNCDPVQPPCTPTPSGDACSDTVCPITTERCTPKCMNFNPLTGRTTVIDCECQNPNECHVEATLAGGVGRGAGNPCDVPDNGGGTVTLPPAGCEYLSPDEVHMIMDGLPAGTTIEFATIHKDFICHPQDGTAPGVCSFPPPIPGVDCDDAGGSLGGEKECSNSTLELNANGTGALAGFNRVIDLPVSFETHVGPRVPGAPVQDFPTDMFRLFGQLPAGDPDFDLLRIVAGTDFGLPSPGHTTLTRLGPPGNNFAVDSFFDITYRIDFVGHTPGPLAGRSGSTTGTIRMGTGNGGPPHCTGNCPTGTVCVETRTPHPDGTIDVCCDCTTIPTGACCLRDPTGAPSCTCSDLTAAECAAVGGHFQGNNTSCAVDGERCATGACCTPSGACVQTTPDQCHGFVCNVHNYCPAAWLGCYADADCNNVVNPGDRGVISANIGQLAPALICQFDLDGNGVINAGDRGIVSANIGLCTALPDWQNGSGFNHGVPDPRFPQPTFKGCGTSCTTAGICP